MGVRAVLICLVCILLSSCGHGTSPQFSGRPIVLDVYPVNTTFGTPADPRSNPARIFLLVTGVGSQHVRLPLAFDTGSSGVTLNALDIFPQSMVGPTGFIFPPGETTITYQGITVTDQSGSRTYGGTSGRTEIGNLGFATITVGDAFGVATTARMPVFFYFAVRLNSNGQPASAQRQQGWFGVGVEPNAINLSPPPSGTYKLGICSSQSTYSCYVTSPLQYLNYKSGVDAGFIISKISLGDCDISTPGGCPPSAALIIGLSASVQSGFTETNLHCNMPGTFRGPSQFQGYQACQPEIFSSTISTGGGSSFFTSLWFDTGTPYFAVNVPPGVSFPSSLSPGTGISFATPSGFVYSATSGTGIFATPVTESTTFPSIVGLGYFTQKDFLIDYKATVEGWR